MGTRSFPAQNLNEITGKIRCVMPQFKLSAFADEISPEPKIQLDVLEKSGVRFVELRSIHETNVLALTDAQVFSFRESLRSRGMGLSAIGSPIGKIPLDHPFEPHLEKFKRAIQLCDIFEVDAVRIFSFYPPESGVDDWVVNRGEVIRRMEALVELMVTLRKGWRICWLNFQEKPWLRLTMPPILFSVAIALGRDG